MSIARILIVDDEEAICRLCTYGIERLGLHSEWTTKPEEALKRIENENYDVLITDIKMPGMTGIELMHKAHVLHPGLAVIVMTAYASIETAIQAVKEGAGNFIHKPFHLDELKFAIQNILEKQWLLQENMRLKSLVNLIDVSEKIGMIHDPSKLYSLVIDAAIQETGATRGKIYHIDDHSKELVLGYESAAKEASLRRDDNKGGSTKRRIGLSPESAAAQPDDSANPAAIAVPLQSNNKLKGVLSLFNDVGQAFSQSDRDIVKMLASQAAIALENSDLIRDIENLFLETIKSLATTLDEKDPYTHGHSTRVAEIAVEIGMRMNLDEKFLEILAVSGNLHDIGKIGIPDNILQKPGRLTDEEFAIIKTHPEKGAKILGHIHRLTPVVEAVYSHHEWFNGKGYPRHLEKDEIPLAGAIVSIADALDTITTDRPYHRRRDPAEAYQIISAASGIQFHPGVVAAVLSGPLTKLTGA